MFHEKYQRKPNDDVEQRSQTNTLNFYICLGCLLHHVSMKLETKRISFIRNLTNRKMDRYIDKHRNNMNICIHAYIADIDTDIRIYVKLFSFFS